MQVRVMEQVLAPGVQHAEEADLRAQMGRVGGDPAQRLGRGMEQDVVDCRLVLEGDDRDLVRHGEDDVEVGDRRAVPPAGPPATGRGPATGTSGQFRLRQEL